MTFNDWAETVPSEIKDDPLWRMRVYQLALFAADLAWPDVTKLIGDGRTIGLADQLYRANQEELLKNVPMAPMAN
jgi:hypothetical protein